ncbi:hypothetical protein Ahy_B09g097840 isoform C [Arachis hypogaea]|uniref:Uncharacterized protein n=1 Tax=Arachis hypogaea TaxID=3818 RepID=A0A444XPZ7_ARAHY|nr:hypothetical protein Ahy_B09g097840 isoform C [Arachis hypogaea]
MGHEKLRMMNLPSGPFSFFLQRNAFFLPIISGPSVVSLSLPPLSQHLQIRVGIDVNCLLARRWFLDFYGWQK